MISLATEPGGTGENEDWAGATPHALVVLDGVTAPAGTTTGCIHGTPWYVRQLGSRLLTHLGTEPEQPIKLALADAISDTARRHTTCDLNHAGTPAAAAGILRLRPQHVDWLVLADITILLDPGDGGLQVVTDDRVLRVAEPQRAETRRHPVGSEAHSDAVAEMSRTQRLQRNVEGGYWVAAADRRAADQAVVGSLARTQLRQAVILTDGAARLVDMFGTLTWTELLLLARHSPADLISSTREAEADDPDGQQHPRYKAGDDATVAYIDLGGTPS